MNKFNFNKLTPFKWFVLENFPFIEADFDALTEWQLFCKIGKEMNKIINSENTLGTQMENVTNAFIDLQNYINNYFDNLDVQEEINNKLNEMVSDGTLELIIGRYINNKIERTYTNNQELITDIGLEINMVVKTLGKINSNDGGGCIYKIVETAPALLSNVTNNNTLDNFYLSLDNGLFAIPYNNINNDYYEEITLKSERINETDCYITEIPLNDNDNNKIELYIKNNSGMEISEYARKHKTTLSINATLSVENPETQLFENASVISNGEIIREHINPPSFLNDNYKFIGIKEDREFVDFQANITTAEQMIAQGVKEAWLCFGKLVNNGVITDYCNSDDEIMVNLYPRQAIGIKPDKTVVILTCDGRTTHDRGLTGVEVAQILIEKGCINVYNLDGGGSTNTVYKGSRINRYIDDNGTKERHIVYCLNAKKPTTNVNIDDTMANIGIEKQRIIEQLLPIIPRVLMKNPANLNDLKNELMIYSCFNSSNYPSDADNYGYLLNIPIASTDNSLYGKYSRQFYFSRTNRKYWRRTLNNGTWTDWVQCDTNLAGELTAVNNQSLGIGSNYPIMQLNNDIANYYPNTLIVEDNKIKTSIGCACKITATFFIDCQLDGAVTIRLRKNGNNVAGATINCEAGKRYEIILQKMQTLGINDYLEFTSNGGTNTGGVNKIVSNNINIEQNIV